MVSPPLPLSPWHVSQALSRTSPCTKKRACGVTLRTVILSSLRRSRMPPWQPRFSSKSAAVTCIGPTKAFPHAFAFQVIPTFRLTAPHVFAGGKQ